MRYFFHSKIIKWLPFVKILISLILDESEFRVTTSVKACFPSKKHKILKLHDISLLQSSIFVVKFMIFDSSFCLNQFAFCIVQNSSGFSPQNPIVISSSSASHDKPSENISFVNFFAVMALFIKSISALRTFFKNRLVSSSSNLWIECSNQLIYLNEKLDILYEYLYRQRYTWWL